ncbi:MAG: type I secretion system permease/ATPase [Marinobacterium sp.]|nr:type I secretion system permease/ATPase [Marinobacterium sp.]
MERTIDPLLECLLWLGRSYGVQTNANAITAGLPLHGGLPPSLFARAARRAGLAARVLSNRLHELKAPSLPVILLLKDNQACLLTGWSDDGCQARVIMPELPDGQQTLDRKTLEARYSGAAIHVRPLYRPETLSDVPRSDQQAHWFWSSWRENLGLYRDVLLAALFINLFALALPLFTMNIYDRVVPNHALETLWVLASGVALVLLADLLLRTLRAGFIDRASQRLDLMLSARIMERVLGMQLCCRPRSIGAFAASLRGFEVVRDFVTSASMTALIDLPFTLLFIAALFWVSPLLTLPALAGVLAVVVVCFWHRGRMLQLSDKLFQASAQRNGVLIESLHGLETLKIMAAEGRMQQRWEQASGQAGCQTVRLRRRAALLVHLVLWLQQLVSVVTLMLGVYLIAAGELSLGGLIAAGMLASRAMAPLGQGSALLVQYQHVRTALQGLDEVMQQPQERPATRPLRVLSQLRGALELQQLSFQYPQSEQQSLQKVSLCIEAGERVAIIGPMGSGKSTLLKLISGLYQPDNGRVLIDGVDLQQLDLAALRQQIGYVPQQLELFNGSLRDNLCMGNSAVTDAQLLSTLELAQLDTFVSQHPHGLEMQLGERGCLLSGGQRQAVVLARALLHRPPLLLLDEATSAIHHTAAAAIRKRLEPLLRSRTLVIATHDQAWLTLVERIIILEQGRILVDGPRNQVIRDLHDGRIRRSA